MKTTLNKIGLLAFVCLSIGFIQSCKNKEPSIVKIFVRDAGTLLVENAKVVIIADVNSNPPSVQYQDTLFTNGSGFAHFPLDSYYESAGEDNSVAYFDIVVKYKDTIIGTGYIRSRAHTTAVETIYLPPN